MNSKRQSLVFQAWKNNGTIRTDTANRFYSGSYGKDALISMEMQGVFNRTAPGVFKLSKQWLKQNQLPHELAERIKEYDRRTKEDKGSDEFVTEPV